MIELTEHFGPLVKLISENLEKNLNEYLHQHGLTFSQLRLLCVLDQMEGSEATLKQLEEKMHTSQPNVVGIVCRLELKNIVDTFGSASDRRVKCVRITEKGKRALQMSFKELQNLETHYMQGFTDEERNQFILLLRKLIGNML